MRCLAILGASGHGKVVADAALSSGWENIIFFDDAWPEFSVNDHWNIAGGTNELLNNRGLYNGVIVGIGDNSIRLAKSLFLLQEELPLVNVVHPGAQIALHCELGLGSAIFAGTAINIDSKLGISTIVNTGSTIDHDCIIGDGVHISSGAHLAGGVTVGNLSWIGIGASVIQNVCIGSEVIVGAGSVVTKDIENCVTVVGAPAKIKK